MIGAEHVNILQRLDGAQGPADEQDFGVRFDKLFEIGGAALGGKTIGRNLRFTLAARIDGQGVKASAEVFQLTAPDISRHRPAGNQRDCEFVVAGVLSAAF